ncbi:hypothetical protein DPMN_096583 [Dreissena polymorpha]|uniref:Uncharacterized protein n=1 Tax=Dreissena polymorpha TaxID=45954 RepID=A0A9D4LA46_DREPO|nr:hypothetical protein DPMN_096583 [Dreissena polymorpha]
MELFSTTCSVWPSLRRHGNIYLDVSSSGSTLLQGCSQVLEAGHFSNVCAVHGDVYTGIVPSYAPAHKKGLLMRFLTSLLVHPMRSMSSANLKLEICVQHMVIDGWWSWRVSRIIFSRKWLNRTVLSRHTGRALTNDLKTAPFCPLRSLLLAFPYMAQRTCYSSSSMLTPLRTCHRPSCIIG